MLTHHDKVQEAASVETDRSHVFLLYIIFMNLNSFDLHPSSTCHQMHEAFSSRRGGTLVFSDAQKQHEGLFPVTQRSLVCPKLVTLC